MTKTRIYKYAKVDFLLAALYMLMFATILVGMQSVMPTALFIGISLGTIAITVFMFIFMLNLKIIVSDYAITSTNLFSTKTLSWADIGRVSSCGTSIKLHNSGGDITIAPSPTLAGYQGIVGTIGAKRPDLFDPREYSELSRSWINFAPLVAVGFICMSFFAFSYKITSGSIISAFRMQVAMIPFIVIAFFVSYKKLFSSPQYVIIEGETIVLGYLFNKKAILSNEIRSVILECASSRGLKTYYINLHLHSEKEILVFNLKPSLPVAYLVLKNWHKQNTLANRVSQQN